MVVRKNVRITLPAISLKRFGTHRNGHNRVYRPRVVIPLYCSDKARQDAISFQALRPILLSIRKQQDGESAFFLIASFFQKHPLESLGERAVREIARSLSNKMTLDEFIILRDAYEMGLEKMSRVQELHDKLRYVSFGQTESGLKRQVRLHYAISLWTKDTDRIKARHSLVA